MSSEGFEEELELDGKLFRWRWSSSHPPDSELGFPLRAASVAALEAVKQARPGARRPAPLLWPKSVLQAARSRLVSLEVPPPLPYAPTGFEPDLEPLREELRELEPQELRERLLEAARAGRKLVLMAALEPPGILLPEELREEVREEAVRARWGDRPERAERLRAAVLEGSHNVGEAREALRELKEPGTGCPDPETFWRAEEVPT